VKNYSNACYQHGLCKKTAAGTPLFPIGRLAEGELIVAVGLTPPKSVYWSFSNYLYTRYHNDGWKSNASTLAKQIGKCADGPSRCETFAGINDPLNHLTAKTTSGTPFNASISIILSTDAKSEGVVASAVAADHSAGPVNTLRFPGQILRLGVSRGDEDELLNVMRVEGIEDERARTAFYEHIPLRVFRATPPPAFNVTANDKFQSFDGRMRNRISGVPEKTSNCSNGNLKAGLKSLTSLIQSAYGSGLVLKDYTDIDYTSFVVDSGYECLDDGTQCQGDCRDTIYAKATLLVEETLCNDTHVPCEPSRRAVLTSGVDDFYFVVGVNHQLTSHSIYSSQTLYNYPKLASGQLSAGADGALKYTEKESSGDLVGSAAQYFERSSRYHNAGSEVCAIPFLYAIMFSRNCTATALRGELCYNVLSKKTSEKDLAIALDEPIVLIERMYIRPGTASGPAVNETILPRLVHFRPRRI
jgi:hypothetical protein